MATRARTDSDDTVDTLLHRLLRVPQADDIVKYKSAIRMHRQYDFIGRPQAGNNNRHFVLDAGFHVCMQAAVALVHDLIDRKRHNRVAWMLFLILLQRVLDLHNPVVEQRLRSGIERRE